MEKTPSRKYFSNHLRSYRYERCQRRLGVNGYAGECRETRTISGYSYAEYNSGHRSDFVARKTGVMCGNGNLVFCNETIPRHSAKKHIEPSVSKPENVGTPGARLSACYVDTSGQFPECNRKMTHLEQNWNHSRVLEKLEQTGKVAEKIPIPSGQWNDKCIPMRGWTLSCQRGQWTGESGNVGSTSYRYGNDSKTFGTTSGSIRKNGMHFPSCTYHLHPKPEILPQRCQPGEKQLTFDPPIQQHNRSMPDDVFPLSLGLCRCAGPKSRPDCANPEFCLSNADRSLKFRNLSIDGATRRHVERCLSSARKRWFGQQLRECIHKGESHFSGTSQSSGNSSTEKSLHRQQGESGVDCLVKANRWGREIVRRSNVMEQERGQKLKQEVENTKLVQEDSSITEESEENQTKIIIMGVGTANSSAQEVHHSDVANGADTSKQKCILKQSSLPTDTSTGHVKQGSTPLRIVHERTSSHFEMPTDYRTSSDEDVSQETCERRRPWSQFYGDLEAEQIFDSPSVAETAPSFWRRMSVSGGSQPTLVAEEPPPTSEVNSGLLSRYFTLRTSTPQLASVDGVLQRFRKSFNFRFQKTKNKQSELPSDMNRNGEYIAPCNANQDYICKEIPTSGSSKKSPKKFGANKENIKVGFRIGSLVLRSSREAKKSKKIAEEINSSVADVDNEIKPTEYANSDVDLKEEMPLSPTIKNESFESPEAILNIPEEGPFLSNMENESEKDPGQEFGIEQSSSLLTPNNTPTAEQAAVPTPVNLCALHLQLLLHHYRGTCQLRRSISQPVALETAGSASKQGSILYGMPEQESSEISLSSSEEEISSDSELYHSQRSSGWRSGSSCGEYDSETNKADVPWRYNASDTDEFDFKMVDSVKLTNSNACKEQWWEVSPQTSGWLSAAYARLCADRESTIKESHSRSFIHNLPGKFSTDQIRASVVQEIITTEQDYVKHLKDVVEGYLRQVRRRPDMFSEECIAVIFGNVEVIYNFQSQFLKHLQSCFNAEKPHTSEIGNCFLDHKQEFKMYSEYCNNHPLAASKLQELYADPKYLHFFEACRLLQEMIDISLDGFLLTPIQRICKYPLQLAELLKYTSTEHNDYKPVSDALSAMQEVAHMVNERKRRMECLEQLSELQQNIEGWEGPDLLDTSSILIHSGEVTRVSSSWSRDIFVFLFDHLLVYCKKDLLKRNVYVYKGRLNLNSCQLVDVEDGKDVHFNVTVKNAWKIFCSPRKKWFLFYTKTPAEKSRWIQAFKEERRIVEEDDAQGFIVTQQDKKAARAAVINKVKPRRTRVKTYKKSTYPEVSPLHLSVAARTGSLPSNFQPDFVALAGRSRKSRKKESSWFHFGSGKKRKK